ncbi:MAG: agmatine deiminase family protein [Deltaproteobacteria bacterium]|nr:agmatine deiminase family protein [Deltaproteobacteria bacterium]
MTNTRIMPAEWAPQSGVQLTFPHERTDWAPYLDDARRCYCAIAQEIAKREKLLVVAHNRAQTEAILKGCTLENVHIVEIAANDTWTRDHGGITILEDGHPVVLDFAFNGWGQKFDAALDNRITGALFATDAFASDVALHAHLDFVLEGGSIESDGTGTILTTRKCLLSPNRNDHLTEQDIETQLKNRLGAQRILWLDSGFLAGDDTDSHIDTLARFCSKDTIAYVQCKDSADMHFEALKKMEAELREFRTLNGTPYNLLPLPMANPMVVDGERLPATYANFLIINGAVLVPTYHSPQDPIALEVLAGAFPGREIVGIDCSVLVKQHGSLHCVTMQYPKGVLR